MLNSRHDHHPHRSGLIEIPEAFRKADSLCTGQRCEIERIGQGEYRVKAVPVDPKPSEGSLVEWLLACPEKGWFVERDRSETTSQLPPALFAADSE
jgi:hypothetical protein